jgi:hypothetical protein
MQLISSRMTAFTKRALPAVLFLSLVPYVVVTVVQKGISAQLIIAVAFFGSIIFFLLKKSHVGEVADEVWDDGAELVIKNRGLEEHVPLPEIVNINYRAFNPQRVTLTVRKPEGTGQEITFIPTNQFLPWRRNPMVDELIARVDAARRQ